MMHVGWGLHILVEGPYLINPYMILDTGGLLLAHHHGALTLSSSGASLKKHLIILIPKYKMGNLFLFLLNYLCLDYVSIRLLTRR